MQNAFFMLLHYTEVLVAHEIKKNCIKGPF